MLTFFFEQGTFAEPHEAQFSDWVQARNWKLIRSTDFSKGWLPGIGKCVVRASLGAYRTSSPWKHAYSRLFRPSVYHGKVHWLTDGKLLNNNWLLTSAHDFIETWEFLCETYDTDRLFARPDSPWKEFSGKVFKARPTKEELGFGFYHKDEDLPIMLGPVKEVIEESRWFVVSGVVVASTADPFRLPEEEELVSMVTGYSTEGIPFVVDVARTPEGPRVVGLNPLMTSEWYWADYDKILTALAISKMAGGTW